MQIELDEGYEFGLGLFETIALEQGTPLLLDWHLERLAQSGRALGIEAEVSEAQVREYLRKEQQKRGALKILVSQKNRFFTMRDHPYTKERIQRGFRVGLSSVRRNETSPLVFHKTMNYGDSILEKRRALAMGLDEMLLLNEKGQLCEGTTTNLFLEKDGILYTPPVSCGLLPGVMRRYVLTVQGGKEQPLLQEDLLAADAAFLTNSLMGIMPICEYRGRQMKIGKQTKVLMQEWENYRKTAH